MYDNNDLMTGFALGKDSNSNGSNNGNGMWGDGGWWIIVILAILFWGGNGFGNGWGNDRNGNGGNSCNGGVSYVLPYPGSGFSGSSYTDSSIQRGFDNQAVVNKLDGISNGICSLGYDQLSQMNALGTAVASGFAGVNNAICNLGYEQAQLNNATNVALMQGNNALQSQLASCCCDLRTGQMQTQNAMESCCCDLKSGLKDIQYQNATDTCAIQTSIANMGRDIVENANANYRGLMDFMVQSKIDSLQQENQALRLSASQSQQNSVLQAAIDASTAEIIRRTGRDCPIPAFVVPNPSCCYGPGYGYGYNNNGCGCNTGCNSCGC